MNEDHLDEIKERIQAILQDGGEGMDPVDVLDCVYGSVSFNMTEEEKAFCLKEVREIVGDERAL